MFACMCSTLCAMSRFIYAFGGAGLFTFVTAISGLGGVAYNSRCLLWVYSTFMVVLLLAQAALAIAYFVDSSWKKRLPHDDTGEARRVDLFLDTTGLQVLS